jgi:hypothetical protein
VGSLGRDAALACADVSEVSPLARKLRIQPGFRVSFVNPPAGYLESVRPLPAGVEIAGGAQEQLDFVQVFARNVAELRELAGPALRRARPDALLWIAYPKGGAGKGATDLPASPWWRRRDVLGQITGQMGCLAVAQVSLDETWTALRFKPGA